MPRGNHRDLAIDIVDGPDDPVEWRPLIDQLVESMSARERLEGRPAYDFGWMWEELGLSRPGWGGPLL